MSEKNEARPFGARDKWGYLFGDFGNDFTFIFASSYLMVFYTKVWGISAKTVGILFLVSRCVDAFTDIGMGRIVDSIETAKRRAVPLLAAPDVRSGGIDKFSDVSVRVSRGIYDRQTDLYVCNLYFMGFNILYVN